jgi:hypothetical protein
VVIAKLYMLTWGGYDVLAVGQVCEFYEMDVDIGRNVSSYYAICRYI